MKTKHGENSGSCELLTFQTTVPVIGRISQVTGLTCKQFKL
jgi:hypothetical protein